MLILIEKVLYSIIFNSINLLFIGFLFLFNNIFTSEYKHAKI